MITMITDGLRYWGQLLFLPVYWLSFFVPRNKRIWLFGSTFGNRFADNPKYFYLYLSQKHKLDVRAVWISHNKKVVSFLNSNGYEAYYCYSLRGIWLSLRGRVYIFDNYSKDINFWTSGGAVKVNLWHGIGNKCINYDNVFDKVRHPKSLWEKFKYFPRRLSDEKPSHYILATSPKMCDIFARAFQVPRGHVIEAGYPRNDYLLGADIKNLYTMQEKRVLKYVQQWRQQGGKINLYMPTFRESEGKFFEIMDLRKFNAFLHENNILFVTKLHPKSKLKIEFERIDYSNIINLDADMDAYVFLREADILTTDYSSVYSDYMLLNRPVVAFWYDYEEYVNYTRKGYFDFEKYMPELKARTMEELMEQTKRVLQKDTRKGYREISREKLFSNVKVSGCQLLFSKLKVLSKINS